MISRLAYFALCLLSVALSAELPVDKCKLEDSACMAASFQKAVPAFMAGLPEFDIEVLDAMKLDDIAFELSGLQFTLKQGTLKGMKNTFIDAIKWNQKKKKLTIEFHVTATTKGHYTAAGRILILPIKGDGNIVVKLKNVACKYTMDYETKKDADGKTHVVPKKYDFDFDVKDGAHYAMTNLFDGNKELSDAMLKFLNDNWKQVTSEFGRPIIGAAADVVFKNIVKYFKKTSLDDITIPS